MEPRPARPKVLVADDEPEHAEIVAMLLTRRGFDVHVVHSGADVLALALARPPSLLLIDVYMPGTDGVAAANRLRNQPGTEKLPIVLVTASPDDRVLHARDALDVVVLEKPFHTAELLWAVEEAMARPTVEQAAQP